MRSGELSFTGPFTFFKADHLPLAEVPVSTLDVGVLGLPYDFAVGYRAGARWAPGAVRRASARFALPPEGYYDLATGRRRLAGVRLADLGDVDPAQLEREETFARVTEAARSARRSCGLPVFVGGDHSLTFPLLRAYDDEPVHVLQFDAHLDYSDVRNATAYSNSSPFRRAVEAVPGITGITVVGLRGMRFDQEAVTAARARGHTLLGAEVVHGSIQEALNALPSATRLYVSFDVDVIEPAELPGTSSPEPGGLSFTQAVTLLGAAIARNRLVGLDLMELAPELDPSGRSELLAARLLAEALAAWWGARTP